MVHLTDAHGTFHARVIAARLEVEDIACELRGLGDWPWPGAGTVGVYVGEDDLELASELLLFDRVEAIFEPRTPRPHVWWRHPAWALAVLFIVTWGVHGDALVWLAE